MRFFLSPENSGSVPLPCGPCVSASNDAGDFAM